MLRPIIAFTFCALAAPLCGSDLASLLVPISGMKESEKTAPANAENTSELRAQAKPATVLYATHAEILSGLADVLAARFSTVGKLTVDTTQQIRPIRVKDADWRVEVIRTSASAPASRMNVTLRILSGTENMGEFQIAIHCALMRDVLVSNRRIDRNATVSPSDFDVQARDVLDISAGTPVPADTNLDGYEVKGALGAGQVLIWRDIALKPTLRRGQVVEAVADEGFLHVAVKAVALEDGREGDIINVRNLSSNKELQARIINERKVQVYF
jgi:flagella basal body P-ring formation protein FlgA